MGCPACCIMNNQESGTLACNYLGYHNDFCSLLRSVSVPLQQRCAPKMCFCEKEPRHWRTEAGVVCGGRSKGRSTPLLRGVFIKGCSGVGKRGNPRLYLLELAKILPFFPLPPSLRDQCSTAKTQRGSFHSLQSTAMHSLCVLEGTPRFAADPEL